LLIFIFTGDIIEPEVEERRSRCSWKERRGVYMAKRKMVYNNLVKNSISAYFAAVELHNKPNIPYRYETVTLLMMNAWELALKAYVKKNIKNRSIFTEDGHTISIEKALSYTTEHTNSKKPGSFSAVQRNILEIEKYRNGIAHFYCDQLEPYIFMLTAKSALNYVSFMKEYFGKDIMADDGLFILPFGFKLPFNPVDFLSGSIAKYASSKEAREFIGSIIRATEDLESEGVQDLIVLGFDVYLESVKKATNSDILAALTSKDEAAAYLSKTKRVRFAKDASEIVGMSDQEFRKIWKYSHPQVLAWCKEHIPNFKQGPLYNAAKKSFSGDISCVYDRKLDSCNPKSQSQKFYTDDALVRIKTYFENIASDSPSG
jgi:hypothetical protein